jgi:outer membrane protein assembly factor BamD
MKKFFLFAIILLLVSPGCSFMKPKKEKTAQELMAEGLKAFNKKRYVKAIESFKKLKDWYPFDTTAIEAELKIADAHFELKEYEESVDAYGEFENLHPRNQAIPYVIYRIGQCYFVQMDSVDRDQSVARKALDSFKRLTQQFPDNEHAKKAEKNITECYKSLVGHEMYVACWQFRTKRYKGAMVRFKGVIEDYPDVGVHEEARSYIPLCEAGIKKQEQEKADKDKNDFTQ